MKIIKAIFYGFLCGFVVSFSGCSNGSSESGYLTNNEQIYDNDQISGCGGFDSMGLESMPQLEIDECDERLIWQYDVETETVHFVHENVELICASEASISILLDEETGVFEIEETYYYPYPPPPCLCFFDFKIDLLDVTLDTIKGKLTRAQQTLWEGELDLSENEGYELIKENEVCWD